MYSRQVCTVQLSAEAGAARPHTYVPPRPSRDLCLSSSASAAHVGVCSSEHGAFKTGSPWVSPKILSHSVTETSWHAPIENMTDLLFPLEAGIQGRESDLSATPLKTGARRSPHCQLCFTYSPQQSRGLGKRGLCGEQSCMLQTHDTGARHCWSWSPRPFCRRRWTTVRKLRRIDETRRKVLISFSTRLHPSFRSRSDYLGKLIGWSVLGGLVPCHAL